MNRTEPDPSAAAAAPGRSVCSLKEALQPSDEVRWVPASQDLEFPPVPFPPRSVLADAGVARLRALVHRHHRLLRASAVGHLFPRDEATFVRITERAADFVVEACGGVPAYTSAHGTTCMRTRHLPFTIDEAGRDLWLGLLWQAMDEVGLPESARRPYWDWVEAMSIRMVNRRTMRAQPPRHAYAQMQARHPAA